MLRIRVLLPVLTSTAMLGAGVGLSAGAMAGAAPATAPTVVPTTAAPAPKAPPTTRPAAVVTPVGEQAPAQSTVPGQALALTVDDGPNPTWTPRMLDLLREHGVHATFCLIGEQAAAYPDLVRRIVAEGHALCNHSEDHDIHLRGTSAAHIAANLDRATAAIERAAGVAPRYFRAPGGNWSPQVLAAARERGQAPLNWSVDPQDWARPGTAAILRTLRQAAAGDVVLVHDGGGDRSQTLAALALVLPEWQAAGLALVTP
jgi:peptidoglycan/xylan/chitin deacetylase (PgdA/CDA1 family)